MAETYGEILSELVDDMAKYDERADVFMRNEIPKGHYYNVINPHRKTTSENPFYCPTEWGVRLTRDPKNKNYKWIKTVAKHCGCVCISPQEIKELKETDPEKALEVFMKIVGIVNGR